jgi:hypothetical protein
MEAYFCGLLDFECNLLNPTHSSGKNDEEPSQCSQLQNHPPIITHQKRINEPLKLEEEYSKVESRLGLTVYRQQQDVDEDRSGTSWYIKGPGFLRNTILFESKLKVTSVCMIINKVIGLSRSDGNLYVARILMDKDKSDALSCEVKPVRALDPAVRIVQIASTDEKVYGLDDTNNGVYEIDDDNGLLLPGIRKWRFPEGTNIVKLRCGFAHFVALSDTGALYSWGSGGRGELGHDEQEHVMVNCEEPKRIDFFDDLPSVVKDISCGGWHTLALTSDGDIYSWGWNESGQLGHSKEKSLSSVSGVPYPVDLGSGDDPVVQISAGSRHSVGVMKCGDVFSWGYNKHGQLGLGDFENRLEPEKVKVKGKSKCKGAICSRWSTVMFY